ncbi:MULTISPECIES: hypothetical protein [Psychrobacter]|jgi:hypothetical protein|uniref:hypothetical protein n=1 Tax=Psychrobacter TaxID=497 RepID=UPI00191A7997|nr:MULTISPECIES: hypothetical protein [Psychrobacter]WGV13741.1 hypothetical protein QJS82_03420 [Psychrobacter sp. WB2]
MNGELTGSDLTRALLKRSDKPIWCAVDDESDEQAMMDHDGNDFTAYIVSFKDGYFYCSCGTPWAYAVPVKISALTQCEVNV